MEWQYAHRQPGQAWRDFFATQFDQADDERAFEVLAVSDPDEGTCYGAYRFRNVRTGEERVNGMVIELDLSRDGDEVGFKTMTEFDGPPQHRCPPEVYALLTRIRHCEESPQAKAWRSRVEGWHRTPR